MRALLAALSASALACAHYVPLVTVPIDTGDASILVEEAFEFLSSEVSIGTGVLAFPRYSEGELLNGGLRRACMAHGYVLGSQDPVRKVWASFRRAAEGYLLEVDLGGVAMTRWYTRVLPAGDLIPAGPRVVRRAS